MRDGIGARPRLVHMQPTMRDAKKRGPLFPDEDPEVAGACAWREIRQVESDAGAANSAERCVARNPALARASSRPAPKAGVPLLLTTGRARRSAASQARG